VIRELGLIETVQEERDGQNGDLVDAIVARFSYQTLTGSFLNIGILSSSGERKDRKMGRN
jgi:hypothetical protein